MASVGVRIPRVYRVWQVDHRAGFMILETTADLTCLMFELYDGTCRQLKSRVTVDAACGQLVGVGYIGADLFAVCCHVSDAKEAYVHVYDANTGGEMRVYSMSMYAHPSDFATIEPVEGGILLTYDRMYEIYRVDEPSNKYHLYFSQRYGNNITTCVSHDRAFVCVRDAIWVTVRKVTDAHDHAVMFPMHAAFKECVLGHTHTTAADLLVVYLAKFEDKHILTAYAVRPDGSSDFAPVYSQPFMVGSSPYHPDNHETHLVDEYQITLDNVSGMVYIHRWQKITQGTYTPVLARALSLTVYDVLGYYRVGNHIVISELDEEDESTRNLVCIDTEANDSFLTMAIISRRLKSRGVPAEVRELMRCQYLVAYPIVSQ